MKESHLVEFAEFSKARNIANKPAFAWWVQYSAKARHYPIQDQGPYSKEDPQVWHGSSNRHHVDVYELNREN
jgi:hypothetical protein